MPPESRIQITVKLPIDLHANLSKAIEEGIYNNMTAAIITALEKELLEAPEMSPDILRMTRKSKDLLRNY